ncbi:MAG: glycosidase [Propionibacteriaceae bacterium]|jgi:predicted GH43/DUF377 family glycosyl hydrolase|nr:glycosidase [Propionibacteriaceae bacterium]
MPAQFPYQLTRLGVLMAPQPGNPMEVEGVLNPASVRQGDTLWLYPRLVAAGNISRIGRARVIFDGEQPSVVREGIALEPERGWEHGVAHGGVEDPRISRIDQLGLWVMTYVAFGPTGPRPALAISKDGYGWERLGPILFQYDDQLGTDLNLFPNKDVVFFPEPVPGPDGMPSIAMLHRPMWDLSFCRPGEAAPLPNGVEDERSGIWISYVPLAAALDDVRALTRPGEHKLVAMPEAEWEALKIGAGPAPYKVPEGWLLLYHGVTGTIDENGSFAPQNDVRYVAAGMILDAEDPSKVVMRSAQPLLEPDSPEEQTGTVANVVFPTAIEEVAGTHFVFYGMADSKIGLAQLARKEG